MKATALAPLLLGFGVAMPTSFSPASMLARRQGGGSFCGDLPVTRLVGDGNPHQDYLHRQVSGSQLCDGKNACEIGVTSSKAVSVGADLGGAAAWISGGFAVTQTWERGETRTCGGEGTDRVCLWMKVAHTAYTVSETKCGSFDGPAVTHVMRSPNDRPGDFYCVVGACRNEGDEYWESGPAGTA